jgi:Cft2 family RNA processing exonuclease
MFRKNGKSNIQSRLHRIFRESHQRAREEIEIKKGVTGQGVSITLDGVNIAIDHWDSKADVLFISHAHMDHIPTISSNTIKYNASMIEVDKFPKIFCSKITKEVIDYRTKGRFKFADEVWLNKDYLNYPFSIDYMGITFTLYENGHTIGSTSLYIEGSKDIFYTSEFSSERRIFPNNQVLDELKPQLCDYLIVDATFGEPIYKFPTFKENLRSTQNIIYQYFQMNTSVILLGYSYGKSQLLLLMQDDRHPICLSKDIGNIVSILESNGIKFPKHAIYDKSLKKDLNIGSKFAFIASPNEIYRNPILRFVRDGAKTLIFSGRAYLDSFRKKYNVNNYIPLSDHSDYKSTVRFIEKCNPQNIFLESGRVEVLSYYLMKNFKDRKEINVII